MNAREIMLDRRDPSDRSYVDDVVDGALDALQAAAGSDRVVLVWGDDGQVTLHGLEPARHRGDCDVCFMGTRCTCGADGSFRLTDVAAVPSLEGGAKP